MDRKSQRLLRNFGFLLMINNINWKSQNITINVITASVQTLIFPIEITDKKKSLIFFKLSDEKPIPENGIENCFSILSAINLWPDKKLLKFVKFIIVITCPRHDSNNPIIEINLYKTIRTTNFNELLAEIIA